MHDTPDPCYGVSLYESGVPTYIRGNIKGLPVYAIVGAYKYAKGFIEGSVFNQIRNHPVVIPLQGEVQKWYPEPSMRGLVETKHGRARF